MQVHAQTLSLLHAYVHLCVLQREEEVAKPQTK